MTKEYFVENMSKKIKNNKGLKDLFEIYALQQDLFYKAEVGSDREDLHLLGMQMVLDYAKEHYTEKK